MNGFHRNRFCSCARCRWAGYVGPAVLVTLGVLLLINEYTRFDIAKTWPILLIVIGVVVVAQRKAPMTGHVDVSQIGPGGPPPDTSGGGDKPPSGGQEASHG